MKETEMWVSRYALTYGVTKKAGYVSTSTEFFVVDSSYLVVGKDAHATEEAALSAAESMRVKKIASLRKQIAKLEGMKF